MASIPINELRPGMRLAYDLRDSSGRLLLAARRPVSDAVIQALIARKVAALPLLPHDDLPASAARELDAAVPRRSWLLASGRPTSEPAPEPAEEPSDASVVQEPIDTPDENVPTIGHARHAARLRAAMRRAAEGVVTHRSARWSRLPARIRPDARWRAPDLDEADLADMFGGHSTLWSADRARVIGRLFARLAIGEPIGAAMVHEIAEEITAAAHRPTASAPVLLLRGTLDGLASVRQVPLEVHALATAAISAAIATGLGWSREQTRAAALAGLLADCGLALVSWDVRGPNRPLNDVEQNALRRHTGYSAAMLEMLRPGSIEESIPEEVQLAAYQHHEREDGSGYPLGLRGRQIHDLARVVGVADVFVGLASGRADRPAMLPTTALAEVARQANAGILALVPARTLAEIMVNASAGAPVISVRPRSARVAA